MLKIIQNQRLFQNILHIAEPGFFGKNLDLDPHVQYNEYETQPRRSVPVPFSKLRKYRTLKN
jgi:hypothetical protein